MSGVSREPGQKPAKRRKIALACNYCRTRKTRCDGKQPACSTCEIKGRSADCVYPDTTLSTKKYVSSLEARVQEYERRARSGEVQEWDGFGEASLASQLDDVESSTGRRASESWTRGEQPSPITHLRRASQATTRLPTPPQHDTIGTDAMVVVPSPEGGIDCPMGESSPIAFLRSMLRTVGKRNSRLGASNLASGSTLSPDKTGSVLFEPPDMDPEAMFLPPRRVTDGFVEAFWKYFHPILPVLHKPTFMTAYDKLWAPSDADSLGPTSSKLEERIFFSTLNIVLAMGCQFSDQHTGPRGTAVADKLYQRSKGFFLDEFLDYPTVSIVQLLLLTGVYLQSTRYANRCWNVIGSAIRAAQSLGLHLERRSDSTNQLERQMERRVWHTCVFLDRQLAVTFGRPMMIPASSEVPMPLMIDDEFLRVDSDGAQPASITSQMGCFVYSNKLFDILHDIVKAFYVEKNTIFQRPHADDWSYEEIDTVMKFNSRLNRFRESLPSHLAIQNNSSTFEDDALALGAKILYSRLLYIRILLLRPILLQVAQSSSNRTQLKDTLQSDDRLEQQLALKSSKLCVATAQTLIAHIYDNMGNSYWTSISHKIHYSFSCAVVLITARLCPMPEVDISGTSLQVSWSQCIEIFEHYKPHFPSASHVVRILEMLEDRVGHPESERSVLSGHVERHDDTHLAASEAFSAQSQFAPMDQPMSMTNLEGLGFDETWAMLDDLLQVESLNHTLNITEEPATSEPNFGWEGVL